MSLNEMSAIEMLPQSASPPEVKTKIATDTAVYTTVSIIAQFVAIVRGFVAARMLGPSSFGIWKGLSIFYAI